MRIEKVNESYVIFDKLVCDVGRASHVLRNYTTGFTTIDHPELYTLDEFAQKIEAQTRKIRAKMNTGKEMVKHFRKVKRSTEFLSNLFDKSFENKEQLSSKTIQIIKDFIKIMSKKMELAESITVSSQEGNGLIDELNKLDLNSSFVDLLESEYNPNNFISELNQGVDNKTGKDELILRAFCYISNKGHQIQDEVSKYQKTTGIKEQANKIVNKAGKIENQARTVIKKLRKKKTNKKMLLNHSQKIIKKLQDIRTIYTHKDFDMQDEKKKLGEDVEAIFTLIHGTFKLIN